MTYFAVRLLRAPQAIPSVAIVKNLTNPLLTSHFVLLCLYQPFVNKTFHILLCFLAFLQ